MRTLYPSLDPFTVSSSYSGQLARSEVIIQVSYSSKHQVTRESLKINHFSVVTDEVVLALFCVVYKTIIHLDVGKSGVI